MDILVVGGALRWLFRKKLHALPGRDAALNTAGPPHIQIIAADQAAGESLKKVVAESFPDTRKKAGGKDDPGDSGNTGERSQEYGRKFPVR